MTRIVHVLTSQFSFNDDFTCSEAYQKEGSRTRGLSWKLSVGLHSSPIGSAPVFNVINAMLICKTISGAGTGTNSERNCVWDYKSLPHQPLSFLWDSEEEALRAVGPCDIPFTDFCSLREGSRGTLLYLARGD